MSRHYDDDTTSSEEQDHQAQPTTVSPDPMRFDPPRDHPSSPRHPANAPSGSQSHHEPVSINRNSHARAQQYQQPSPHQHQQQHHSMTQMSSFADSVGNLVDKGPNARLYQLLQLDPSVPAPEIYETFRALTLRKQYRLAFQILSDEHKKRVYDMAGEDAVDALETKTWGTAVSVLGSTIATALYGLGWCAVTVLCILFFIMLPLHIDSWRGTWRWKEILSPLYILFSAGVFCSIVALVLGTFFARPVRGGGGSLFSLRHPAVRLFVLAGYTIFLYLTGTALENANTANVTWMHYFAILLIVDVVAAVERLSWKHPGRIRRLLEPVAQNIITEHDMASKKSGIFAQGDAPAHLIYGYVGLAAIEIVLAVLRYVFIGLRLDSTITWSWYTVVIPTALTFLSSVVYHLQHNRIRYRLGHITGYQIFTGIVGRGLLNAALIISTFLIARKLEHFNDLDLVIALVPVYFVLFYLAVASVFTFVYFVGTNIKLIVLERDEAQRIRESQPDFVSDEDDSRNLTPFENSNDMLRTCNSGTAGGASGGANGHRNRHSRHNNPIHDGASSSGTESIVSEETIVESVDEPDGGDYHYQQHHNHHPDDIHHHQQNSGPFQQDDRAPSGTRYEQHNALSPSLSAPSNVTVNSTGTVGSRQVGSTPY